MINNKYFPIIGVEVHLELKTKTKMFCGCKANHFRALPNTQICPVCLGLPGALPVPNKKAIEWCLLIGLSLDCKINQTAKFDRKNYFYPDLPKGYQISQYDQPFCQKGKIQINNKLINVNRVHMEEDTGKLVHATINNQKASLVDFNRSGVPLVEIVSEAEINSSDEAVLYLKKIQQIIRYLGVSDGDMEKGSMRCEINISLKQVDEIKLPDYKVEIKNVNSFRFVKKAIEYEIKRQTELLTKGEIPLQETRGFSERNNKTFSQRSKEEAHDYRYFPEPDIPPFEFTDEYINSLKKILPELPDDKKIRFIKQYDLSEYYADILTQDKNTADYFEQAVKNNLSQAKEVANLIINKKVDINIIKADTLVNKLLKQKTNQITDSALISKVIAKIVDKNEQAVADYKKGKIEVLGFLIGQVMSETKGKANPKICKQLLEKALGEKN